LTFESTYDRDSPSSLRKTAVVVFPFTAIVAKEEMKLSLMLNVIDPKIGGVMIMGDSRYGKIDHN
jgi:magnesium chelatase subunit I